MPDSLNDSLLLTKLNRPRISRDLVQRPRLLSQLQSPTSLVLVVAPAGYGKTTLVGSWLDTISMPSAWLALDESDNDLTTFVNYLIAAIQTRLPSVGKRTATLMMAAASPSVTSVSHSLINELSSIEQEFVLVLDDYHVIHNRDIHKLLTELLHRPPKSMHLVLAARNDPALPLPGLMACGLVTELRAADLSFTLDETMTFFRDVLKLEVTDQEIATLNNRTEGWPVSLRLAAIYFQHSGAGSLVETNQRGGNRYLMDYLVKEVTTQIPANARDFLMKTSILDELYGPLCDAVMEFCSDSGKSQKQLNWLVDSDLFTTPVINTSGWYRYHHLFRQYLARQLSFSLSQDEISGLHLRASRWFDSQRIIEKAISHAFAAGSTKDAVKIFVRHRLDLLNADDAQAIERVLKLFPRQVIDKHPELKLAEMPVLIFRAQLAKAAVVLKEVESMLPKSRLTRDVRDSLEGEIASWRSTLYYWMGDSSRSGLLARQALKKLPVKNWFLRLRTKLFLGVSYLSQGDFHKAVDLFEDSEDLDFGLRFQSNHRIQPCFIYWLAADLDHVKRSALQVIEMNKGIDQNSEVNNWGCYFAGIAHYHQNDLGTAEALLSPLVLHPDRVHSICYINSTIALALTYQVQGLVEKAIQLSEMLLMFAHETTSHPGLREAVAALNADLALQNGDLGKASRWADDYQLREQTPLPYFYASFIIYIRTLLAKNTPASLRKAAWALAKLKKSFTADHQTRWLISVLTLFALLHQAKGDDKKAMRELEKAVSLAEPGGFIRLFVDLGEPMRLALVKLLKQRVWSDYIARILSAFEKQATQVKAEPASTAGTLSTLQISYGLTNREQEVLQLLEKRFTDKEIAETLSISRETVRSHIAHLGDKLGTNGRRAIVQTAREIGLLD